MRTIDYAEAIRRRSRRNSGAGKKKSPWANRKQSGQWRICKFKRCKAPHRETLYTGHCSVNCQLRRQVKKDSGYQFDLGHSVRSGWERRYADWLIRRGVQYEYEPKTFYLKHFNKKTRKTETVRYIPDFYIPHNNTWVEVKGLMTERDLLKIRLFQKKHRLLIIDKTFFNSKYSEL